MGMKITIRCGNDLLPGEITNFDVVARCPVCGNETSVTEDELRTEVATCQHCDEEFNVYLGG